MPYAQVSDVRSLIPFVPIDAGSKPSEGQVGTFIRDVESTLNTTLRAIGYTVPFIAKPGKTTDEAISIVRQMVSNAVAAMVLRARPQPETDPEAFQKRYDAVLKALRDPDDVLILPDIELSGDAIVKEGALRFNRELLDDLDTPARVSRAQVF